MWWKLSEDHGYVNSDYVVAIYVEGSSETWQIHVTMSAGDAGRVLDGTWSTKEEAVAIAAGLVQGFDPNSL